MRKEAAAEEEVQDNKEDLDYAVRYEDAKEIVKCDMSLRAALHKKNQRYSTRIIKVKNLMKRQLKKVAH